YRRKFWPRFVENIVEKKPDVRNAARDHRVGSRGALFRSFTATIRELGCDELRVTQPRDDVAMAGQVIGEKCIASRAAAAARVREDDDRANAGRFRGAPELAREAASAGSVERLHAPIGDGESARDEWVVHRLAMITPLRRNDTPTRAWREQRDRR